MNNQNTKTIIGVDFDNTIVCYDKVFHSIAVKKGCIPINVPQAKEEVRNYLREHGKEEMWVELQGMAYGPEILNAKPFDGVMDFFMDCKKHKIIVYIISHKTLYPFLGLKHSLHEYAQLWLERQGFYNSKKIGLTKDEVFFELTKEEKLKRIIKQGCTHFVDDLPEFLSEKGFPKQTSPILFDPNGKCKSPNKNTNNFECVSSWNEMSKKII